MGLLSLKNNKLLVEAYFLAWQKYDHELIKKVFSNDACYIIIKKNISILNGIDEIISYWKKNELRQQNIQLSFSITKNTLQKICVDFIAIFFDRDEQENQRITGWICFYINERKIEILKEGYKKETA